MIAALHCQRGQGDSVAEEEGTHLHCPLAVLAGFHTGCLTDMLLGASAFALGCNAAAIRANHYKASIEMHIEHLQSL